MAGNEWVVKVTADVKGVLDASRQIGQAGKQAGQEFKQGFGGNEQTINGLRGRLSSLNQTLEKAAIGSLKFKQTQREIAATQRDVDRALGQTTVAAKALTVALNGLGALGVSASVVGFLKGSITNAIELETITRKLSATLGPQGAAGALAFASETANTLGLNYKQLANTFGSFTAAATASGVPMQQQRELFAAVASAGQKLGLTNEDLRGTFTALQQVASKGVVSMEELRQQLGERLPIALAATAKGLGISQGELIKLVETGRLSSGKFFPALTKGLNDLTASASGTFTAAQNFNLLQNAWENLQISFGTNLLPTVTKTVTALVDALKEIEVQAASRDLRDSFGLAAKDADQLVGHLEQIAKQYGISYQEAKNLLSVAIANTGASRDWFGELNLGGKQFEQIQRTLGTLAKDFAAKQRDILGEANATAAADGERLRISKEQNAEQTKQLTSMMQLYEMSQKRLIGDLANRATEKQAIIDLGTAVIGLEESRFNIVRNRNNYELDAAQKRGASEAELEALKRRGEATELAALNTKYRILLQQQELQRAMLSLQQQQAYYEADLTASNARIEVERTFLALQTAKSGASKEATAQAQYAYDIAVNNLNAEESKLGLLDKMQPIQRAIAQFGEEQARNLLIGEGAAKGLQLAADGTFQKVKDTANSFKSYGDSLKVPLAQQAAFAQLAKDVGLEVRTTRDGFVQIGQTLGRTSSPAANNIKTYMSDAAKATNAARNQASALANNMGNAAGSAEAFYRSLAKASGLPPGRFAGGPVDAGQTYRINDGPSGMSLGQEAFLSASGALSLINRPANSLWTAPSKGTIIPANVTSRLKESGALGGGAAVLRGGSDPAVAHLALAVGNLSQEVAELRRKAWNVSVGVRGDGSGLRLAQATARMF
jgi:tape measure domain-containing protein